MILKCFIVLCLVLVTSCSEYEQETLEQWTQLDKQLKSVVSDGLKKLMGYAMESAASSNISSKCMRDNLQLISGLKGLKEWAFKLVDSTAKSVSGILSLTVTNLGDFEECVDTSAPDRKNPHSPLFSGRYCTVNIRPPLPPKNKRYRIHAELEELRNFTGSELLTFLKKRAHLAYYAPLRMGVCVPSGCSTEDVEQMAIIVSEKLGVGAEVAHCEVQEEIPLNGKQIFIIVVSCIFGCLVIYGTSFEIHSKRKDYTPEGFRNRLLLSFSAVKNFKRLTCTDYKEDSLRCVPGIEFLSITWLFMCNSYNNPAHFLFMHQAMLRIEGVAGTNLAQIVVNSAEVMDTFIFLGGLLVSYHMIKLLKVEERNFSFIKFFFKKLWKVWPTYAFIVFFAMLTTHMGRGPIYKEVTKEIANCDTFWWRNLVFVNNFYRPEEACLKHSWYIAADFQLYLASLLVILPLVKSRKLGMIIASFFIVASIFYNAVITALYRVAPLVLMEFLADPDDFSDMYVYTYANILSRAGPYVIGILTGYCIALHPKLEISKVRLALGWALAVASCSMVVAVSGFWLNVSLPSDLEVLLFAALAKVAWTAGVAWMTLCCATRHAGFIHTILSWKLWVVLSKLTFLMYLIQPIWQALYIAVYKTTVEYTHLVLVSNFSGMLVISGLLALVAYLLVQAPLSALPRAFFPAAGHELPHAKAAGATNNGFDVEAEVRSRTEDLALGTFEKPINLHI